MSQDYSNFEIIVFDDCSTDNSIDTIKKFKNVKLIENKKKKIYLWTFKSNTWYH